MNRSLFKTSIVTPVVLRGFYQVALFSAVVFFSGELVNGQTQRVELTTGIIEIGLDLPADMRPFSEAMMAEYHETGGAGEFVYTAQQGKFTVIINTFGNNPTDKGLTDVADRLEAGTKQQGTIIGAFERQFVKINGLKWLRVSFRERTPNVDLINECFVIPWVGKYVMVEFSSEEPTYANYKAAVARGIHSVQLGFIAEAPESTSSRKPAKKN